MMDSHPVQWNKETVLMVYKNSYKFVYMTYAKTVDVLYRVFKYVEKILP